MMNKFVYYIVVSFFFLVIPVIALYYMFDNNPYIAIPLLGVSLMFHYFYAYLFEPLFIENIDLLKETVYDEICIIDMVNGINNSIKTADMSEKEKIMLHAIAIKLLNMYDKKDMEEVLKRHEEEE